MTHDTPNAAEDVAMARAFLASRPDTDSSLDLMILAAWLDGRLDESDAEEVDATLASNPDLRHFITELRLNGLPKAENIKPELLQQLQELTEHSDDRYNFTAQYNRRAWWISSGIAASIAIAVLGFWAGHTAAAASDRGNSEFLAIATFDVFNNDDSATEFSNEFLELTDGEVIQ
jgi:hypothetical protein